MKKKEVEMEGKECGFVAVGSDQISPALSPKHLGTQSSELIDRMHEVPGVL